MLAEGLPRKYNAIHDAQPGNLTCEFDWMRARMVAGSRIQNVFTVAIASSTRNAESKLPDQKLKKMWVACF